MFTRDWLIEIREKAKDAAMCEGLNRDWQRAYLRLADAADYLDAMMARTEENEKRCRFTADCLGQINVAD